MKICGFEIEAYVDEFGIIRRKNRSGKKMSYRLSLPSSFQKLIRLDSFLRENNFPFKKAEFNILVQVVQKVLKCSKQTAYKYAYTLWALKH